VSANVPQHSLRHKKFARSLSEPKQLHRDADSKRRCRRLYKAGVPDSKRCIVKVAGDKRTSLSYPSIREKIRRQSKCSQNTHLNLTSLNTFTATCMSGAQPHASVQNMTHCVSPKSMTKGFRTEFMYNPCTCSVLSTCRPLTAFIRGNSVCGNAHQPAAEGERGTSLQILEWESQLPSYLWPNSRES